MAGASAWRFSCKTAGILSASLHCGDTAQNSRTERLAATSPPSITTPGSSSPPSSMLLCTLQSECQLTSTHQPGPHTRSHTPPTGQVKQRAHANMFINGSLWLHILHFHSATFFSFYFFHSLLVAFTD